jgi:hypothetical protein
MNFTEKQKDLINQKYNSVDHCDKDFSDVVEVVTDYLLDENIVDISDDEEGDAHEDLHNSVWEYLELKYFGTNF